jgi:hypothetical protein
MGLFGSKNSPGTVMTSISGDEMVEILRDEGHGPELTTDGGGDPLIRFKSEGLNCHVVFYGVTAGRGLSIQFRCGFREKPAIAKVNDWNRQKRFVKAYLDHEDDLIITMDVDLEGGVTRAHVIEQLNTWRSGFIACARFIAT